MNTPIKLGEGSLTMCDINDFRDTLRKEHTVVTLCRYTPKWSSVDKNERHHYYFRAHNKDPAIWSHAIQIVMDAIAEGKDVLLHCVHGRDRTGGVGYAVLRLHDYEHDQAHFAMAEARPCMASKWDIIIPQRREMYEEIIEEYINQQRERR